MLPALVVLWLGTEPELAAHRAEVAAWAGARQARATLLRPTAPSYDGALADRIEALLEEARAATAAPGTPSALERAEALLLEHPELPQAAWLLAERFAIEAQLPGGAGDAAAARRRELALRAQELEGARAQPAGAAPLPAAAPVSALTAPAGARPNDRVFVDGVARAPAGAPAAGVGGAAPGDGAPLAPARHHVRVTRAGLPVWSGWLRLDGPGAESFSDPTPACSALDLADVAVHDDAPAPAPGVRCPRWAAARVSPSGGLAIAECSRSRCAAWQLAGGPARDEDPRAGVAAEAGAWPSWATWSLVGAGALVATGLVLWRAGAFERDAPATEFVFTGPSAAAYRF